MVDGVLLLWRVRGWQMLWITYATGLPEDGNLLRNYLLWKRERGEGDGR